jgi:hypothetical protein
MKKTVIEWLNIITNDNLREKAISNTKSALGIYTGDEIVGSLSMAIAYGFDWEDTTEGNVFWDHVYDQALNGDLATNINE